MDQRDMTAGKSTCLTLIDPSSIPCTTHGSLEVNSEYRVRINSRLQLGVILKQK